MNKIQGTKPDGQRRNRLLFELVTIIKYKAVKIYHDIYIKVFSDRTVFYLTVCTDDVVKNINNETKFHELTRVFEEHFEIKFQEGSVLKYLNLRIFQYSFSFSVDQTYHIMELVNEWFPTGKFRKFDTPFRKYSTYEK